MSKSTTLLATASDADPLHLSTNTRGFSSVRRSSDRCLRSGAGPWSITRGVFVVRAILPVLSSHFFFRSFPAGLERNVSPNLPRTSWRSSVQWAARG